MLTFIFACLSSSWYDTSGRKIKAMDAEEFYEYQMKKRTLEDNPPLIKTEIDEFTFYNFSTTTFNKENRMGSYEIEEIETMAMWYGRGEGPFLSKYYTYISDENDQLEHLNGVNTILYLDTFTLWIYPTSTTRVKMVDASLPVYVTIIVLFIVVVVLEILACCTKIDIMGWCWNKCNHPVVVHRHRTHHHNWVPPNETMDASQAFPLETPEDNHQNANSNTPTVDNHGAFVPPPPPPPPPPGSRANASSNASQTPSSPAQNPYAEDPYATNAGNNAQPKPAADPYSEDPYATKPGNSSQPTPATDPYSEDPYATKPASATNKPSTFDDSKQPHPYEAPDPYANAAPDAPPPPADPADDW